MLGMVTDIFKTKEVSQRKPKKTWDKVLRTDLDNKGFDRTSVQNCTDLTMKAQTCL